MASGGDLVTGFEEADALVAVGAVAVLDVAGQRPREGVPVEVVGVVAAAPARLEPDAQAVFVQVISAEDVAGSLALVVGRALSLGALADGPAGTGGRLEADRPHLIERDHMPAIGWRCGLQFEDPCGLGLVVGIRAGLPRAGALERQTRLGQ